VAAFKLQLNLTSAGAFIAPCLESTLAWVPYSDVPMGNKLILIGFVDCKRCGFSQSRNFEMFLLTDLLQHCNIYIRILDVDVLGYYVLDCERELRLFET